MNFIGLPLKNKNERLIADELIMFQIIASKKRKKNTLKITQEIKWKNKYKKYKKRKK